jgi:hypothetical protein
MKKFIVLLSAIISSQIAYAVPVPGSVIGETTDSATILRYRIPFEEDTAPYAAGGVIFNYANTFENSPEVFVSIALPTILAFDPTVSYSAVVTSNTVASVTIRVNKLVYDAVSGTTTIEEAATNEVNVNIFALNRPY